MKVFREFRFEAAHSLPDAPPGHKCRRLHGHSYRLVVHIAGPIQPRTGWVMDFAELKATVQPVIDDLDHRHLNELPGLAQPTAENICRWIWQRLHPSLPGLARLELYETAKAGCVYEGEDERPNR